MKKFRIVRPKKFIGKDGAEKTQWLEVGTAIITDEKKGFVELNHSSERLSLFLVEPKEQQAQQAETTTDNIPF